jgi:Ca2+-transporting ATPase
MDTFASIALCSEPPRDGLMQSPPKRRDESIVTGAMWQSILTTSVFYVVVMMALLIIMKGTPDQPGFLGDAGETVKWMAETSGGKVEQLTSLEIKQSTEGAHAMFTMRQVTIFFTAYVLFQVWNMINCRSLSSRVSGLSNLAGNPNLLLIAALIVGFQVILVQFLGALFNTEPLTVLEWALIALATSSVLIFGEVARLVGGNRSPASKQQA